MSYKWRLWCDVHEWVYDWSDTPITQCPIENSDTVDTTKTFKVGEENVVLNMSPIIIETESSNYERVCCVTYDSNMLGKLYRVKVMSYMDKNVDDYEVEVYDQTNEISLCSAQFTNTGDYQEKDVGLITSPPEGKIHININMRRNGKNKKYAHISGITFYTRKEQD